MGEYVPDPILELRYGGEYRAWLWLMQLPRIDFREVGWTNAEQQIIIRCMPGELKGYDMAGAIAGYPRVYISLSHPQLPKGKRVSGHGNSLSDAVRQVHTELWHYGIKTPFLFEIKDEPKAKW